MGHHSNTLYAAKVAALPRPHNQWPKWILTGGGLGFLKPAPGSWGTLPPALAYWVALNFNYEFPEPYRSLAFLAFGLLAGILLIRFGQWGCAYFQQIDPGQIVLDEYAGFALTVAFLPVPTYFTQGWWHTWLFTAVLYILFRLTDTLKIPPGRQLEKLPWGWGILLDDVAAGIQANLLARLFIVIAVFYI